MNEIDLLVRNLDSIQYDFNKDPKVLIEALRVMAEHVNDFEVKKSIEYIIEYF